VGDSRGEWLLEPLRGAIGGAGSRFSVPRGLIAGTLVATALVWGPYAIIPGSSLLSAQVQTSIWLALVLLTICSRRAKVLLVRTLHASGRSSPGTRCVP
jgi:hypothetical protein